MNRSLHQTVGVVIVVAVAVVIAGTENVCQAHEVKAAPASKLPPEPTVTHSASDAEEGERIEHGELILTVDEARKLLHAQHHPHGVVETRRIPGRFQSPAMTSIPDFALSKKDLTVINPGPGEFVHVMEGQRHGYKNLTIGITYTAPGGAPPMHTHQGEEAHVLLEGKILYALGDEIFVMEAPYIVNIPPMVPHSFQNLGDELAELVVIFPTNVWEYDERQNREAARSRAGRISRQVVHQPERIVSTNSSGSSSCRISRASAR